MTHSYGQEQNPLVRGKISLLGHKNTMPNVYNNYQTFKQIRQIKMRNNYKWSQDENTRTRAI